MTFQIENEICAHQRSVLGRRIILEALESCLEGNAFPAPLALKLYSHLENVLCCEDTVRAEKILGSDDESDEEFLGIDKSLGELQPFTLSEKETVKAVLSQKISQKVKQVTKLNKALTDKCETNESQKSLDERVEALEEYIMSSNAELNELSELIDQIQSLGTESSIYSETLESLALQFKMLSTQLKNWKGTLEVDLFSKERVMAMNGLDEILSEQISTLQEEVEKKKKKVALLSDNGSEEYKTVIKELKIVEQSIKKQDWVLRELSED